MLLRLSLCRRGPTAQGRRQLRAAAEFARAHAAREILPGMGTVHLAITTSNPGAQQFFDQGLAQMHSFWAREAERSFLQAAALDPAAPMPQWGIAMVAAGDWRPRFQIDTLGAFFGKQVAPATSRARVAAKKAVELSQVPGKATDLEKLYIAAVAARRDPDAKDPEEAFVKGMRAIAGGASGRSGSPSSTWR